MIDHLETIMDTVTRPDVHEDDLIAGRERFFRRDLDPSRWLRVVVDFNRDPGRVVTAFIQDNPPDAAQ